MRCPNCGASSAEGAILCLRCGQVLDPSGRLPPGYVVADRFEIRRFLGQGGMGTVYEVFDRRLDERMALKILKPDFARSQEMERRFRKEIKLARRLRHPNVCAIHEYDEAGPLRYITLELIEGTDLKRRLKDHGAPPPADAFRIALQLAQGLDCIHKAGVVHRDLKTSNVMLDSKGDVRLMDFGIAKQLGDSSTVGGTAIGAIIGTPEYMSPEQGRGEAIDTRSDLYSFGIVIYEIFTGDVPFRGDTPIATILKTIQTPLDLDGPAAQGLPPELKPVLMKALAKSPDDRYATAEEMAAALIKARDGALGAGTTVGFPATRIETPEPRPTPRPEAGHTPQPEPRHTPQPEPWPGGSNEVTVGRTAAEDRTESPRRTVSDTPGPPHARREPVRHEEPVRRPLVPLLAAAAVLIVALGVGTLAYLWSSGIIFVILDGLSSSTTTTTPPVPHPSPTLPGPSPTAWPDVTTTTVTLPPVTTTTMAPVTTTTLAPVTTTTTQRPVTTTTTLKPPPPTVPAGPGQLQFYVKPWADVYVDGNKVGTTPLRPLELPAGRHEVQLRHPDFAPLTRTVTVEPGRTAKIEVNFSVEGQRLN
jgi:serine/threonine protein kinase